MPWFGGIGGLFNMGCDYGSNKQSQGQRDLNQLKKNTGLTPTTFDVDLHKESYLPPEEQGQSEQFDWEEVMKSKPPGVKMRNTEPFVDPITGKLEEYVPNKPAEQAPSSPNTAGTQRAQMFGQFGNAGKTMGSVWDQLKGAGGKIKKGLGELDAKMEQNYKDMGYAPEEPEKPWSINELKDDQWHNRKDGILVDPNDPEWKQKLMELSRDEQGIVQPDRQKQLRQYYDDTSQNSLAVDIAKEKRVEDWQKAYDKSGISKGMHWTMPGMNWGVKQITPRIAGWYQDTFNKGGNLTEKGQ